MGKIQCEICRKKCKGDVLKLDQKFIHKGCFNCYKCNKNLEKGGFFCRDNRYFCSEDYQKLYGVKCGFCNKYADGEVVTILGGTFHIQCFQCQNCNSPFCCGDKATLWDGKYLCHRCASVKQEKENIVPPLSSQKSITESDIVVQMTETPIIVRDVMANQYDSSDTDGPVRIKPKECLQLHIENGYTSTDSGVEKTKSEMGYTSQHSPCYSFSSGEESFLRSTRGRKSRAKGNYNYGRYLNPSYLQIQERITKHTPPNAVYCGSNRNPNTVPPITSHFHRPENFSYRSSPNINMKKGMSLLVNPFGQMFKKPLPGQYNRGIRPQSTNDVNLSEEVKRLAHYPDGKRPDPDSAPPIDRYDFPAPPSLSVVLQDMKKEKEYKKQRSIVSTGDIFYDTQSGTDTAAELGDFPESEDEKSRKKKVELTLKVLRETGKYSGLSQTVLDQLENNENRLRNENYFDPISASRSPDASMEPSQKPRYDRHTFTSPSRDNRYEGRPAHHLSYRVQYSNTGGRTGTLPGAYTSTPQPGYTQGYLSCTEDSASGRPTNGLNYRASSLPRPLNLYTPVCVNTTNYLLDGHMSPSMTTSGYSVDATTHSIDESTLIGGSGLLNATAHRNGYMSDMAPLSAPYGPKKTRPDWFYESENEVVFHSNYPTVQSYLKPSNILRTKEKIPAETFPYEKLKINNFSLPKGMDRSRLEDHLTDNDFELVFQMSRSAFSRLPEWKRNDLKRKVDLY